MAGKYCAGCGEQKRLRYRDTFCKQRCAAETASTLADAACSDMFCTKCGEFGCGGLGCNPYNLLNEEDE